MDYGYFARGHLGHGTLVVGHKTAVRSKHFERAAKPLVGIPQCWLASPQFGGLAIVLLNHTRGINRIDGHGTQIEQGAITLLRLADRFFRSFPFGEIENRRLIKQRSVPHRGSHRRTGKVRDNDVAVSFL
jgi:hypothetical protein